MWLSAITQEEKNFICCAQPEVAVMSPRPPGPGCLWLVLYLLLESSISASFHSRNSPVEFSFEWLNSYTAASLLGGWGVATDPCLKVPPTQAFFGSTALLFMDRDGG